jgi:hypothetical protein
MIIYKFPALERGYNYQFSNICWYFVLNSIAYVFYIWYGLKGHDDSLLGSYVISFALQVSYQAFLTDENIEPVRNEPIDPVGNV